MQPLLLKMLAFALLLGTTCVAARAATHVVPGKVMAADVAGKELMVKSVQGSEITVNGKDGVMVDNAKVIKADIVTDNGVIHVIDAVIMPKM